MAPGCNNSVLMEPATPVKRTPCCWFPLGAGSLLKRILPNSGAGIHAATPTFFVVAERGLCSRATTSVDASFTSANADHERLCLWQFQCWWLKCSRDYAHGALDLLCSQVCFILIYGFHKLPVISSTAHVLPVLEKLRTFRLQIGRFSWSS